MIIDSSAIVAIALNQAAAGDLLTALEEASSRRISAGNLPEACMVIDRRRGPAAEAVIAEAVTPIGFIVEPVTEAQVLIARDAFLRFGKDSGHSAQLNYGDCFAYSLARMLSEPLLFIGNDFVHTDITPAL